MSLEIVLENGNYSMKDYTMEIYSKADFDKLCPVDKNDLIAQYKFNAPKTKDEIKELFNKINVYGDCYYSLALYSSTAIVNELNLDNLCFDISYLNTNLI